MNLNISYNWLKQYVKTDLAPAEFAKKISLVGPSVDHITEIKPRFEKVVVGQIVKIDNHPNADKLHVCEIDTGKDKLQIVCGAQNIKEGQKVPVVLVGGKVGDFEITAAKLRGVDSFGMLCSQKELGIADDHSGIFILPADTKLGEPLEKVMPLQDTILDVEVTSNRPDAMGIIGLAREAAAALDADYLYKSPKPDLKINGEAKPLAVKVSETKLCPRYSAVVMSGIKVAASPLWLQQRLLASGLRSINNLVDITNYILLEYGQPMHVFDYDKLLGSQINVRLAKKGEKILALDGKEYELSADQLVIADQKNPVAVAGVMGGELSAASSETTSIVFESANFNPVSVRRTSRALNLRSDSSALYEKGLSPENTHGAMLRAIELSQELAGGRIASKIIDENSYKFKPQAIKLKSGNIARLLGVEIPESQIKKSLSALGFLIKSGKKGEFDVTVPWWRENDVAGEHDLIEEVARMYGYGNLPTKVMAGDLPARGSDKDFALENRVKDYLAGFGLTEIYTYSFTSEKVIKNCGLAPEAHIRIANPLSADFEYMRTSLLPGALQIIDENQGLFPEVRLFDLSKVYLPVSGNDLPREISRLLIICSGNDAAAEVKGILEALLQKLHIDGDAYAKNINLIDKKILSAFGIKKTVAAIELDLADILQLAKTVSPYQPIPKFPAIELDLSMELAEGVPYGEVVDTVKETDINLIDSVEFLSVYQGEKIETGKKALAIRIRYRDLAKTLTLPEAQQVHDKVVSRLKKSYNISVR